MRHAPPDMTDHCALQVPFPPGGCASLAPASGTAPGLGLRIWCDIYRERVGAMGSWVVKEVQSLFIGIFCPGKRDMVPFRVGLFGFKQPQTTSDYIIRSG